MTRFLAQHRAGSNIAASEAMAQKYRAGAAGRHYRAVRAVYVNDHHA